MQETLLHCWKKREEYDPAKEIGGWVHYRMRTVAHAHAKRARVRERAAPLLHEDDVAPSTPERETSIQETDSLLRRILDSLKKTPTLVRTRDGFACLGCSTHRVARRERSFQARDFMGLLSGKIAPGRLRRFVLLILGEHTGRRRRPGAVGSVQ